MQKNNLTILSTGELEKEIANKAFDFDIIIETIPFISTKPIPDEAIQKILDPLLNQFTVMVVTSRNAVEALAANLKGTTPDWRFFCIGGATASSVKKYFGNSAIAATADNALDLARATFDWGLQEELYFFCGDQRRDDLPGELAAKGVHVTEVVIYETTLTPHKLTKDYEGILFFSPSAVKSFFSVNQLDPETVLFTIGPTTAEALKEYTTNTIIISEKPGKEEVINKVIEYFKQ